MPNTDVLALFLGLIKSQQEGLTRIAAAVELMARIEGDDAIGQLARQMSSGSTHDFIHATEQMSRLNEQAQLKAELKRQLEGMKRLRSETLDGKPYSPKPISIPQGVEIISAPSVKAYLDKIVLGQERATRLLAINLIDMYFRITNAAESSVEKNNLLFIGPSGVGKTHLAYAATDLLALPYVKVSATALASKDGEGVNFTHILRDLCKVDIYGNAKGKQERRLSLREGAQYGILFIDEIDKLKTRIGLQHDLLPILERGEYRLGDGISLDTSNMWIIAAGAFGGIEEIVRVRTNMDRTISRAEILSEIGEKDLVSFGFIPELARRFQGYVPFVPLSEEILCDILSNSRNSLLSQYQKRFAQRGYELEVEKDALRTVAKYCLANSEGANGLRTGMMQVTEELLFNPREFIRDKKVVLTEAHAKKTLRVS